MKILMSGFTATHVLSKRRSIISTPSTFLMYDALQHAGHQVEARPIIVGEDLTGYHRVIVGIAPPNAFNAQHVYGALWAISQMYSGDIKGMLYLNDWNVRTTIGGFRSQHNCGDRSIFRPMLPRTSRELATSRRYKNIIKTMISLMSIYPWKLTTLLPIFDGGDIGLVTDNTPIWHVKTWDPTPLYPREDFELDQIPMQRRHKEWVIGALSPQKRWVKSLGSSWGTRYYGCKSLKQERVSEAELVKIYCHCRGVLSHRYYHSGAGWWRTRFLHAAMTRSVMYCDPKEGYVLGQCYMHDIHDIERMSAHVQAQLADEQRKVFWSKTRNKNKVIKHLDRIIKGLRA